MKFKVGYQKPIPGYGARYNVYKLSAEDKANTYASFYFGRLEKFLQSVCVWGNFDKETENYFSFEVAKELVSSVTDLLVLRFNAEIVEE